MIVISARPIAFVSNTSGNAAGGKIVSTSIVTLGGVRVVVFVVAVTGIAVEPGGT